MSQEIQLQKDDTGQHTRLFRRFVHLLFGVQAFTKHIHPVYANIETYFEDITIHRKTFDRTAEDIYDKDIIRNRTPTMLLYKEKYVHTPPTIAKVIAPIIEQVMINFQLKTEQSA